LILFDHSRVGGISRWREFIKDMSFGDLYAHYVYHRINERHPRSGMPCSRILNEMYTDLEVSRSHEAVLDKATLTCRSADRKVISGQLTE